ncbi:T-complex protein 1 subunit zeta-2 [Balaenoptera musculus]|uniref:T-complex protein 1 subunit zeta-2 n=1 Tax=Balaenoptera musculus TaxID=9771 RepID=A0A8B8WA13_BALMU|nr:T-complex protein 1 subunit zeta-2 [Balaenoptera musculus]
MAAIKAINSKAEVARAQAALSVNICATRGLQDVLRTNLGPKGTMKMLVSGAGDIKLTKDGNVLLHEMQIQHPTASLIAKVATAQDDITGDGTTSNVLIIRELLKQADLYISEGLHPRIIAEGFEVAKIKALEVLEQVKIKKEMKREILLDVAGTPLQTKVHPQLADVLTEVLAQNSGYDLQETLVKVQVEHSESKQPVGIDLNTGEPMVAADAGVWDNYCVKKQLLHSCTVIATNILLADEIMRAGMSSLKG